MCFQDKVQAKIFRVTLLIYFTETFMRNIILAACLAAGGNTVVSAGGTDSLGVFRSVNLEEVVVSVNREQTRKINTPQHILNVNKNFIGYANKQSVADLLTETGQVLVQKSQQGGGSPVLRGFEASRILLVVDGVRMNNLIYRSGHLQNCITVDQFMLNNMEVLFGPSSLSYGSDALGGTIIFNTQNPVLSTTYGSAVSKGHAVLRYGSANNEGTAHIDYNYGTDKFGSLTSFTFSNFGDLRAGTSRNPFLPDDDSYIRSNIYVKPYGGAADEMISNDSPQLQKRSGYLQYDFMQKLMYRPDNSHSHTLNFQLSNTNNFNRYDRLSVTEVKNGTETPKFAEWYYGPQFRLMAAYHYDGRRQLGADQVGLTLAYQNVKESRHDRKFRQEELYHSWENVNIVSLSSDWIKRMDNHKLHLGIDGTLSFLKSTAETENVVTGEKSYNITRYPDGKNSMHTIEAFATHVWNINNKWSLHDGLRLGYATTYSSVKDTELFPFFGNDSQRKNNLTYSAAVGLNYLPSKTWKTAFSVSTAYRVPNIDNTSKVFDSKVGTVTIPNKHIRPEKTVTAELNVTKHVNDLLTWENVAYATYYFDAITTAPGTFNGSSQMEYQGELCDVYTYTNAKAAVLWGASSSLTARPSRQTELYASFNYTFGRIVSGEKKQPLDHIPPIFGRVGAAWLTPDGNGRFDMYALYNGRKSADSYNIGGEDNIDYATVKGENGEGMPAWFTLNIKGSYNLNRSIELQAGVENILNTEYRVFSSGINAPGRNIYAAVRMTF